MSFKNESSDSFHLELLENDYFFQFKVKTCKEKIACIVKSIHIRPIYATSTDVNVCKDILHVVIFCWPSDKMLLSSPKRIQKT